MQDASIKCLSNQSSTGQINQVQVVLSIIEYCVNGSNIGGINVLCTKYLSNQASKGRIHEIQTKSIQKQDDSFQYRWNPCIAG
jgi:hypothetical protein